MPLYPFKFKPRFVEKMWGGRKIESVLGKSLPPEKPIGESWELYDFPPGVVDESSDWVSSPIANGPYAGQSLHWAVEKFGPDLTGDVPLVGPQKQFPLLVKFLDAREDLSVQVHPDEKYASQNPDAHLKSEAWFVMEHDAGARLFKGLRPGTTREHFRKALDSGTVEHHLAAIPVKPGDCHYLPSGTVHALGAGILVAEVQTPSDTTFRVFDFNRVDPSTGKRRTLHVEQAMQCINFNGANGHGASHQPHDADPLTAGTRLVTSPYFHMEKLRARAGDRESARSDEPVVWIMMEGEAAVSYGGAKEPVHFRRGETVLLPASMQKPSITAISDAVWLEVTFPKPRRRR